MRVLKIYCNKCGKEARIETSSDKSEENKVLYCACKDLECGHTFVMTLSFSHTLSPSSLDLPESFRKKIQHMSPTQQKSLFAELA